MTLPTLCAIVPTRSRTRLAIAAVRSLLDQDCPIEIFVSDNSPTPDRELRDFCGALFDRRVTYMRPPESLDQAAHWDWAVREAMRQSAATHFSVHYDRKISKPNHLDIAHSVAGGRPGALICWSHDYVADVPPPMRLWQPAWTGDVFALRTARLAELIAQGRAGAIPSYAFPLLSNCLVPREALTAIVDRFGSLCDSTTPDSCFAFRFAALGDEYLYLDRTLGVLYAADRSAGGLYLRAGGGSGFRLAAAPLPGLNLGLNMLYHEYELVRRATGGRFAAIDRAAYLRDLAASLPLVGDPGAREACRRALRAEGWSGRSGQFRQFVRHRLLGALDRRFGIRLPNVPGRVVRSDEEALQHALRNPPSRSREARGLAILQPVKVAAT